MIKIYVLYLLLGTYLFFESALIWTFSFNGVDAITYLALASSIALCPIASSLTLYNIRTSLIVGLVGLLGVFPFGIYWLVFRYTNDYFTEIGTENTLICVATILYFVSMVYTIKLLINYKSLNEKVFKRRLKILIAIIPVLLFLVQIFLWF